MLASLWIRANASGFPAVFFMGSFSMTRHSPRLLIGSTRVRNHPSGEPLIPLLYRVKRGIGKVYTPDQEGR